MAIATEIGRLQGAKQDLISRLKAKGVSVPENATLEEITPLIDNISGSEDLDAELTEQETLISQLSTILDSKASGGGGTCTLICNADGDVGVEGTTIIYYTKVENGAIKPAVEAVGSSKSLSDVLCGSTVYISEASWTASSISVSDNITNYEQVYLQGFFECIFSAPTEAGAIATVTLYE